jgi:hypothetical protein
MKKVFSKPLPTDFSVLPLGETIIYQFGVKLSAHSRLQAKVLLFKNRTHLRKFWRSNIGSDPGARTLAVVSMVASELWNSQTDETRQEVDPRYFCVMGFNLKDVNPNIICHESVHAGFCYARRVGKRTLFENAMNFDEEEVAYPSGEIAAIITKMFAQEGYLK